LAAAGIDHKAGQAVRIVDIPVKCAYGLFDELHGQHSGARFSELLAANAVQHYGHAGPAFVHRLLKELPVLCLDRKLTSILATYTEGLSPQYARAWRTFATVALAGELALSWNILPWEKNTALAAATNLFSLWLSEQPQGPSPREYSQICKAILDIVDTHLDSRLSDIDWTPTPNKWDNVTSPPLIRERAGYFQDVPDSRRLVLFTSAGLRAATKGFEFNQVIKAIDEHDAFAKTGASQKAVSTRIPAENNRVVSLYHIDLARLHS
jgi:putative DNA primase/helicase